MAFLHGGSSEGMFFLPAVLNDFICQIRINEHAWGHFLFFGKGKIVKIS